MKYLKIFLLSSVITLLNSCSQKPPESKQERFKKFIGKLKPIKIPYRYQISSDSIAGLSDYQTDSTETEFLDQDIRVAGYLPHAGNGTVVLGFYTSDWLIPTFFLFDKDGARVDTLNVSFGDEYTVYSSDSCRYYFSILDSFKIIKEKQCSIDSFKVNTFISTWDYYVTGNKFKLNIETEKK